MICKICGIFFFTLRSMPYECDSFRSTIGSERAAIVIDDLISLRLMERGMLT